MTPHRPKTSRVGPRQSQRLTCSLSEAAELLGVSRAAAYRAAARGEIPTLRVGSRLLVPLPRLHQMLGVRGRGPDGAVSYMTQQDDALGPSDITTKEALRAVAPAPEGGDRPIPTKRFMEGQQS